MLRRTHTTYPKAEDSCGTELSPNRVKSKTPWGSAQGDTAKLSNNTVPRGLGTLG